MDLTQNFSHLYASYKALPGIRPPVDVFFSSFLKPVTKTVFKSKIPAVAGIYLIWRKADELIYIGSSTKVSNGDEEEQVLVGTSSQKVSDRLTGSLTPYNFYFSAQVLRYKSKKAGKGYTYAKAIPFADLEKITVIETWNATIKIAPSALEHVLLQGYFNQFGKLPLLNQKI